MPKSKVRKKVAQQRKREASSGVEAMMIPVWEYPDAMEAMQRELQEPEETCFQILMSMPIRSWSSDKSKIAYLHPVEQAEKAGVSIEEWYQSYLTLHEIGALTWDYVNKAHYMTSPN